MKKIRKCSKCGKYTVKDICCGEKTLTAHPPKFSTEDKYAKYRRMLKAAIEGKS